MNFQDWVLYGHSMRGVWSLDILVFIRWFELLSKRYNGTLDIQDREGADSQMPHFIIVRVFIWEGFLTGNGVYVSTKLSRMLYVHLASLNPTECIVLRESLLRPSRACSRALCSTIRPTLFFRFYHCRARHEFCMLPKILLLLWKQAGRLGN
jgi:hypothetical protein